MIRPNSAILSSAANTGLYRALLRASRDQSSLQDQIDCAELALQADRRDLGAILYGVIALQIGFSSSSTALLYEVDSRTGLWGRLPPQEERPIRGLSVDLAIDDLKRLMGFDPVLAPLPASFEPFLPTEISMGTQPSLELDPVLADLSRRTADILVSVPLSREGSGLRKLLQPIAAEVIALRPIRVDEHVDLPLDVLVRLFALERTRRFLVSSADLLAAQPETLFDAAAALEPGVLGPFFSNIRLLLRNTRDIFALIDAAAGGRADPDMLECWSVLFASHLPVDHLAGLTADLGDRGMVGGLRRILIKIAREGAVRKAFNVAYSIRDASLDIDAFALAGDAQQLIALWRRADANEWRRLGEIRGFDGDLPAARTAFERAVQLNRYDEEAQEYLTQIESGKSIPFIERSMGRRLLRRARLKAFQAEERTETA